jgi:cell division protein FtsN
LAKSDEGEFELVLGNRQLISVFLIVVVLLGVFFSMGYIVGRNSAAPGAETARTDKKSVAVEPPSQPASSNPAPSDKEPAATTPEPAADRPDLKPTPPAPVATHPEKPSPAPVTPAPVSAAKPKPAAIGPATITGAPASGEYWQVVATARPDAEIISELLTKKGLHAQVAPGPREGIFRVLVGPFKDSATLAQTRTSLEAAGFKNPIKRTY